MWQSNKKKEEDMVFTGNKLWKQTIADVKSIATDKHPKAMYFECMKNDQYMHHYASQSDLPVTDLAAIICKDFGCVVNYCGLLKKSYVTEWEDSSDCENEVSQFGNCMKQETRRYTWMGQEEKDNITKYDYIQKRLGEKKTLNLFKMDH